MESHRSRRTNVAEHELSASLEQEGGATEVGEAVAGEIGAYCCLARHAVKRRSEVGLRMWHGKAWRGRAGQAFGLGEPGE